MRRGAVNPEVARWPCGLRVYFWGALLGCSVTLSKARDGKVRLNIKSLGGRTSDSEHFVMI